MSRFLWTQKEDIGPSARFGHAMTYDSVRSRTVLFGGSLLVGGQVQSVNDTWEARPEGCSMTANATRPTYNEWLAGGFVRPSAGSFLA